MQNNSNKLLINWLFLGVFLILLMIAVGGTVRLSNAGLSIVEWKPISGVIPPLTEAEWQSEFDAYKNIPEYKIEHNHFKLKEFKKIFYLEYFHRLVARIVGFVFIIPFIFFWIKGYFREKKLFIKIILIFLIASFQAWLGWYMVSSGLFKGTDVSHYRLAIHLLVATFLVSFVYWIALELKFKDLIINNTKGLSKATLFIISLVTFQLLYGAFSAGLNAGYYYTGYPKMGGEWFPIAAKNAYNITGILSFFEDPSMVHFIHRWFAIVVLISILLFYSKHIKLVNNKEVSKGLNLVISILSLQVFLGILTLLTQINIYVAVFHQVNGILLYLVLVHVLFLSRKTK